MDFPVQSLEVLPAADFDTAVSSLTGSLNVELLKPSSGTTGEFWTTDPMTEMFQLSSLPCMAFQDAVLGQEQPHKAQYDDEHLGLRVYHPGGQRGPVHRRQRP